MLLEGRIAYLFQLAVEGFIFCFSKEGDSN